GKKRLARVTTPIGLTELMAVQDITCKDPNFFLTPGNGWENTPYLIGTPKQLDALRCSTHHTSFRLSNNIDLTEIEWLTPNYITGLHFDGAGFTLKNFNIDINVTLLRSKGFDINHASFLSGTSNWIDAFSKIRNITF